MNRRWVLWLGGAATSVAVAGVVFAEQAAPPSNDGGVASETDARAKQLSEEQEKQRRATPIAKVNGSALNVGHFEDQMAKQGPFRRAQFTTPEKQLEFVDEMIAWELRAQEARRRGYNEDDTVRDQVRRVMSGLLLRRQADESISPEDVTEEEIAAHYQENIDRFQRPERVRAYHIVMEDRAQAQALLDQFLDDIPDAHEFRRAAREKSEDAVTKRRGGDLRYFPRPTERGKNDPDVDPAISKATFDLLAKRQSAEQRAKKSGAKIAPNKIPGFNPIFPKLVETKQGFHIIRFMGHRDEVNRTLEKVSPQIRNRIWRDKTNQAREDFYAELREKAKVSIDEDNLELVVVDTSVSNRDSPVKARFRPGKMPGPPRPKRRLHGGPSKRGH